MVFTGLTSSGAVTTNESQIASYMVGNNSSTNGNGLVSAPTNLSALKIPGTHNGKPVTKVGDNAFSKVNKIAIVNIGDNIITIGNNAFSQCTGMTKLTIVSGLNSIGTNGFNYCSNLKTVIIDSSTIASALTSQTSCGRLVYSATTVYTKSTPGAYITTNFNVATSDIDGYTKYVKK